MRQPTWSTQLSFVALPKEVDRYPASHGVHEPDTVALLHVDGGHSAQSLSLVLPLMPARPTPHSKQKDIEVSFA